MSNPFSIRPRLKPTSDVSRSRTFDHAHQQSRRTRAPSPPQGAASTSAISASNPRGLASVERQRQREAIIENAMRASQPAQQSLLRQIRTTTAISISNDSLFDKSALLGRIVLSTDKHNKDYAKYFQEVRKVFPTVIEQIRQKFRQFRISMQIDVTFYKIHPSMFDETGGAVEKFYKHFKSNLEEFLDKSNDVSVYDSIVDSLTLQIEDFQEQGSGWLFQELSYAAFSYSHYTPLGGGEYIPIPKEMSLRAKRAGVFNPKVKDNQCFRHCIEKQFADTNIDFSMLKYPTTVDQIPKFEKVNRLSVYVFTINLDENLTIYPTYPRNFKSHFQETKDFPTVDLLRLEKSGFAHYCLVESIEKLFQWQWNNNGELWNKYKFCRSCCHSVSTCNDKKSIENEKLTAWQNHIDHCWRNESQRTLLPFKDIKKSKPIIHVETPTDGSKPKLTLQPAQVLSVKKPMVEISDKVYNYMRRLPLVVYADYEAYVKKTANVAVDSEQTTTKTHTHELNSYGFNVVCPTMPQMERCTIRRHRSSDTESMSKLFLDDIQQLAHDFAGQVQLYRDIIKLDTDEQQQHDASTVCYLCKLPFDNDKKNNKVRDHNHQNGKYLGAAHSKCNLLDKTCSTIPVFFHNFRGYDSHHLFMGLRDHLDKHHSPDVSCIMNSSEKMMTLTVTYRFNNAIHVRVSFKDSMLFMNESLEQLVNNLADVINPGSVPNFDRFNYMKKHFNDDEMKLICTKGVYPYSYVDSASKFNEPCLPPIDAFRNDLKHKKCDSDDYEHAQTVYQTFKCKTFGDYHDLYLKSDILLLSDVFEQFRLVGLREYRLDPAHYVSLPSFAWDSMLLTCSDDIAKAGGIELISDWDMYLTVESGIRGGLSMITHRHAKANNPACGSEYDSSKPNSYIQYEDKNNLYGFGMTSYLPTNNFQWMNNTDLAKFNLNKYTSTSKQGCIVVVDGHFPDSVHDKMKHFPMLPEHKAIPKHELSNVYKNLCSKMDKKPSEQPKLIAHLGERKNYAVHYKLLQLAVKHGFVIDKIHKVITFNQAPWMKRYIDKNTKLRAQSKNEFEKNFYKLMNNAPYGKTIENVRKHVDNKMIRENHDQDKSRFQKYLNDSRLERFPESIGGMIPCSMRKKTVMLDKPIMVGFCILELSKYSMCEYYYDYLKPKYKDNLTLLMTDTDSFIYHVEVPDFNQSITPLDAQIRYDFSGLPKDHPLASNQNKKVINMMKPEFPNYAIVEFCGVKTKMYALRFSEPIYELGEYDKKLNEKLVHKGISSSALTNNDSFISFDDYRTALFEETNVPATATTIRSFKHEVFTVEQTKSGISSDDNKRFLIDNIESLPYGHYKIKNNTIKTKSFSFILPIVNAPTLKTPIIKPTIKSVIKI